MPVLLPLCLGQELVVGDQLVPVGVALVEDVLAHPLHLLHALLHVVVGVVRVVHLVQLLLEQHLHLVLVPVVVAVQVVHGEERLRVPVLGAHVVLLLPHLLQLVLGHRVVRRGVLLVRVLLLGDPLLLLLPLRLVVDVTEALVLLKLLLHLVGLEVLPSLLVRALHVTGGRLDQLAEILLAEVVAVEVEVVDDHAVSVLKGIVYNV